MIIRRLGVMSVAKISALIGAVIGLLAGLLFFLVSLAGGAASAAGALGDQDPGMTWISGLGAMAIVVLPIVYAVFGFVGGAIQAFFYNIAAKFVGGIRIETE
ncbi:MAG TPA: hypothetical protein VJ806_06525 [Luteimonas sp.]|nr:hypothetical protein [Luteimonas sp.]